MAEPQGEHRSNSLQEYRINEALAATKNLEREIVDLRGDIGKARANIQKHDQTLYGENGDNGLKERVWKLEKKSLWGYVAWGVILAAIFYFEVYLPLKNSGTPLP